MKKIIAIVCVGASLASCTATERGASVGAVGGAILGGAISGNVRGAAIGAAAGGVTGAVIGDSEDRRQGDVCVVHGRFRDRYVRC
jgi:hypothetical protein